MVICKYCYEISISIQFYFQQQLFKNFILQRNFMSKDPSAIPIAPEHQTGFLLPTLENE